MRPILFSRRPCRIASAALRAAKGTYGSVSWLRHTPTPLVSAPLRAACGAVCRRTVAYSG